MLLHGSIYKINSNRKLSGLKLNNSKSVILQVGSLKKSTLNFRINNDFVWTSDNASTLGIVFTNEKYKYQKLNLEPKLKEFENCLNRWKKHKLSLIGKITVIKTFALPKLIYPLTVLNNPSVEVINLIKKYMFNFLWDGKPDKINRKTIIQDYENNGLKMIDIDIFIKSIKAGWVKRLTNTSNNGDWKHIYIEQLKKVGGSLIFECNINANDIKSIGIRSTFLSEILTAWSNINFTNTIKTVHNQILWNNSNIKTENKTIFFKKMYEAGIKIVEDIFNKRHNVFYTFQEVKNKYLLQNSNFLNYYAIIKCISHVWKQILKTNTEIKLIKNCHYYSN